MCLLCLFVFVCVCVCVCVFVCDYDCDCVLCLVLNSPKYAVSFFFLPLHPHTNNQSTNQPTIEPKCTPNLINHLTLKKIKCYYDMYTQTQKTVWRYFNTRESRHCCNPVRLYLKHSTDFYY